MMVTKESKLEAAPAVDDNSLMATLNKSPLKLALIAQSLYLANLLAVPIIAMFMLFYFSWRYRNTQDSLGACHLFQASALTLWFMLLVVGGALLIWLTVGDSPAGMSMTILYAIVMHTSFVMVGVIGLANAISGKHFHPINGGEDC